MTGCARTPTSYRAVALLRCGRPRRAPNETVHGLVPTREPAAVARVRREGAAARPPLIVHLGDAAQVDDGWAREIPSWARLRRGLLARTTRAAARARAGDHDRRRGG